MTITFWAGGGLIIAASLLYAISAISWDLQGMGFAAVIAILGLAIMI